MMNGRLISVSFAEDSSIFAFSAASFSRCESKLILSQVDTVLAAELLGEVIDHANVEILAAQEGVTIGALHLEDRRPRFQSTETSKVPPAKVIDHDGAGGFLVEAIGERCRRRLG